MNRLYLIYYKDAYIIFCAILSYTDMPRCLLGKMYVPIVQYDISIKSM